MTPQRQLIHGLVLGDTKAYGIDLERVKDTSSEKVRFTIGKGGLTAVFTILSECYTEQVMN